MTRWTRTFDPPGSPADIRPLSDDELETVMTGSGSIPRHPGGSSENNPDHHPYRGRGMWPNPGIYEGMRKADAIIGSSCHRRELTVSALPFRILDPPEPTPEEEKQSQYIRDMLSSLPGGIPGIASRLVRGIYTAGFALMETIWETEETTKNRRIERLKWVDPWTVYQWVESDGAQLLGAIIRDSAGQNFLAKEKMVHHARGFNGHNWEGDSAMRPLWYVTESKRRTFLSAEIAAEKFGEGVRHYQGTVPEVTAGDIAAIETLEGFFRDNGQDWSFSPYGIEMEYRFGSGSIPPYEDKIRMFDHQLARGMDDTLPELGISEHGARAVGSEQRESTENSEKGLALSICRVIDEQIIYPTFFRNGWDDTRRPRMHVTGFVDWNEIRVIAELVRDGVLSAEDPAVQSKVRREMGID